MSTITLDTLSDKIDNPANSFETLAVMTKKGFGTLEGEVDYIKESFLLKQKTV